MFEQATKSRSNFWAKEIPFWPEIRHAALKFSSHLKPDSDHMKIHVWPKKNSRAPSCTLCKNWPAHWQSNAFWVTKIQASPMIFGQNPKQIQLAK
jgi:hypothetical protein